LERVLKKDARHFLTLMNFLDMVMSTPLFTPYFADKIFHEYFNHIVRATFLAQFIVFNLIYFVKVKVKCILVQALKLCTGRTAHRGSKVIALLFLEHCTRRGEGSTSRPGRSLPPGKAR
jgi:hypothetical protein